MKQLISTHISVLLIIFSHVIFSSDNHMGTIDTFVLKQKIQEGTTSISKYLTDYSKPENHFSSKEPIFITINGSLHPIDMPTNIKPFIVIINDAKNIIDKNPDIFCSKIIQSKIPFLSKNQSNKAIHKTLGERIIPVDHCTYVRENNGSIDIVSIFFNKETIFELIPTTRLHEIAKKKRVHDFLDIPKNNHSSSTVEFDYEKNEDALSILRRVNRRYHGGFSSDEENPDIVQVPNYNFWDDEIVD